MFPRAMLPVTAAAVLLACGPSNSHADGFGVSFHYNSGRSYYVDPVYGGYDDVVVVSSPVVVYEETPVVVYRDCSPTVMYYDDYPRHYDRRRAYYYRDGGTRVYPTRSYVTRDRYYDRGPRDRYDDRGPRVHHRGYYYTPRHRDRDYRRYDGRDYYRSGRGGHGAVRIRYRD